MMYSSKFNFIVYSALKTFVTFVVYQIAIFIFSYAVSYILSWFFGLIFGYVTNTKKVFKKKISYKNAFYYFIWNIFYVTISIFIIGILINDFQVHERIAPILFLLVVLPINYFITKVIISHQQ